ncbi:MAG: SH3 domain-containing protein [Treponema sp.]|nr:SH3 domain-containing protein [Treponema sp.]
MKNIFIFYFFLFLGSFASSEELLFRVIEDAPAWHFPHSGNMSRGNSALTLKEGEIVEAAEGTGALRIVKRTIDGSDYHVHLFVHNNRRIQIQAHTLVPANTLDLFNDSWITSFGGRKDDYWILAYYLNVLRAGARDAFREVDGGHIDAFIRARDFDTQLWYETFYIDRGLEINQISLSAGGFVPRSYWVTSIIVSNNGFMVTISNPQFETISALDRYHWTVPLPTDRRSFNILLIKDNDYLDMYLETTENLLATFVRVNRTVVDELNNLLRTNTVDLSRITAWPRRADGSMDFPPPGIDISSFRATHTATVRLRARDDPTTTSLIVTTLDLGAEVQILETGPTATIDGITAPWVRIQTANGFTGWSFSGYLEPIQLTVQAVEPAEAPTAATVIAVEQFVPVAQHDAATSSMPTWLLAVIVGGAATVGGTAFFAVKRKR